MQDALGSSWMTNFESFDRLPFAAASIGQVHSAVLAAAAVAQAAAAPETPIDLSDDSVVPRKYIVSGVP